MAACYLRRPADNCSGPLGLPCLWPWRLASVPSTRELSVGNKSAWADVISRLQMQLWLRSQTAPGFDHRQLHDMHAHTPARPSACIPGVHARNWGFRGTNALVLQRLLSLGECPGAPWAMSVIRVTQSRQRRGEGLPFPMEEQERYLVVSKK